MHIEIQIESPVLWRPTNVSVSLAALADILAPQISLPVPVSLKFVALARTGRAYAKPHSYN